MPAEPLALSTVPPPASVDTDYDAICAAVTATARGRWFLDEFSRRNRHSDTRQVLAAIARMEATVVGDRAQQAHQHANQEVRIELLEMARAIAQARAEVAESQQESSQRHEPESSGTAATNITGAAERLRQIAWTMRACGVELAASNQIGQIADAILSANALPNLGDQRAHKLTEALHYLEHRIDRMLDGHVSAAAAGADGPAPETLPQTSGRAHDAVPEAMAAAAIGAAIFAAAVEAETEPALSPANDDTPPAAVSEQAAAAPVPEEAAPADAAAVEAEFPMDEDVVLTVTGSAAADDGLPPLFMEFRPASVVAAALEPTPLPSMEMAPASFVEPAPAPMAESIGPAPAPPSEADLQAFQVERVELEIEPLVVAPPGAVTSDDVAERNPAFEPADMLAPRDDAAPEAEDETETTFGGFELVPLAVAPAVIAEAKVEAPPADAEQASDRSVLVAASIFDGVVDQPEPSAGSASPAAEPDRGASADDNLPLTLITDATTAALADPEVAAAPITAAARIEAYTIAMQVDQDLDGLADIARGDIARGASARAPAAEQPQEPGGTNAGSVDDPADFLLEALPLNGLRGDQPCDSALPPVPAASTQVSSALVANALAAIETELRAGIASPTFAAVAPPRVVAASVTSTPPTTDGQLAALMALSEEERIALFS